MPRSRFDAVLALDNGMCQPAESSILEAGGRARAHCRRMNERMVAGGRDDLRPTNYCSATAAALRCSTPACWRTREHLRLFREVHERWSAWRHAGQVDAGARDAFKYANDQPHVGLALQSRGLAQPLDMKFNRLWWRWWQDYGRRSEWPFKIYAKSSAIIARWLPPALTRPLAAPGLRHIDRALAENHFLHFAGSKSPLLLLAHRSSHRGPSVRTPSTAP